MYKSIGSKIYKKRLQLLSDVDLYPVITGEFCRGRSPVEVLDKVLAAGVKIVQLREKKMNMGSLYDLAILFREKTKKAGALLIVNDHIDLALAVDADGVHLGQDDLPLTAAKAIAPDLIIGLSTHNLTQAQKGEKEGAAYVNIGPIYATGTKPEHKVFHGPQIIEDIGPKLRIPFTVMGGIKIDNIAPVLEAGARHIAVVTAVTAADDIEKATTALRKKILENRK